MPNKTVIEVIRRLAVVEEQLRVHLIEGSGIKKDLSWLKWINMGIAALVFFKMVAEFIRP